MGENAKSKAGANPATSTVDIDGMEVTINEKARQSWDGVFLVRDIEKVRQRYKNTPESLTVARNNLVADLLELMLEYVCYTTDITRERISAHLGKYATVPEVAEFLNKALGVITSKN